MARWAAVAPVTSARLWGARMTYEFDVFELDEAAFELRGGGRRIEVRPKVLSVLLFLVKNRSRFVSKDELQAALWPTEAVGPTSLPKTVHGAREVLRENGLRGPAIRTVWGRGYRFVLPVYEGETGGSGLRDERFPQGSVAASSQRVAVGDGVAITARGDVLSMAWTAPASMPRIRWVFDEMERLVAGLPDGFLVLVIVSPTAAPPDYATAMEILSRQARFGPLMRRHANVVLGKRLWFTLVVNALRAMHGTLPTRLGTMTISATIDDGIARLQERKSRLTPDSVAIRADVASLCEALGAPWASAPSGVTRATESVSRQSA
jgi:DNA-binding winged helix-turn-helix (wHTH) protein